MRNDETYLKMVLALPEDFFKDWKWQAGDKALVNNEIWTVFGGNTNGMVVIGENLQLFSIGKLDFARTIGDKARPIPSQEQLQEMLIHFHMTQNKFSRKRAILHIMGNWADYLMRKHDFEWDKIQRNEDYELVGDHEEFDILMLKFVVGVVLLVEWNGKEWL